MENNKEINNSSHLVKCVGKIIFDPPHFTKKETEQSSWKKVAMVVFEDDLCAYYSKILKRRFRLLLNKSHRGPHVTFISDSIFNLSKCNNGLSDKAVDILWQKVKDKWNSKPIDVVLNLHPVTNTIHWWLVVDFQHREELQGIRTELGLDKPFFGLHMTIGKVNDNNKPHSEYISRIASDLIFVSKEKDLDEDTDQ